MRIKEAPILNSILTYSRHSSILNLYRNNTGLFESINKYGTRRKIRSGLGVGSSDCIGYTKKKITNEMVGQDVAIFTAVEVKSPTGKATERQKFFIDQVNKDGGIAGICRSIEDVEKLIKG